MNAYTVRRDTMLEGTLQFLQEYTITPAIPRVTALTTEVGSLQTSLRAHAGNQVDGNGAFRSGTAQRRFIIKDLRRMIADISSTAHSLDPAQFPGVAERFRNEASNGSYAKVLATAAAFLEAVEPIKTVFTDRAHPADFDTAMEAKIAAFAAASGVKQSGRLERMDSTASLRTTHLRITVVMRELRALVTKHLRNTNPSLIPVWKAASRASAAPRPAEATTPPPDGGGSGSGTPPPSGS